MRKGRGCESVGEGWRIKRVLLFVSTYVLLAGSIYIQYVAYVR